MSLFTDTDIDELESKESPYKIFEGLADKGFGIQVSPAGKKTFFMQYKSPETGKKRFMSLMVYVKSRPKQSSTITAARTLCRKARLLVDKAIDPQIERDELKRKKHL